MPARFTILASGSSGNCAYLETEDARLLIDAGLSARQIRHRLLGIGRTPENLSGILVTHEHTDHIQGLGVLASKLRIPIYCNRLTKQAIQLQFGQPLDFRIFSTGGTFDIGDVLIETFTIPHDAYDPVGFLLRTPSGNIGFLTDLGHAPRLVIERVRPAHALVLEANHDVKLLQDDLRRPWSTKQRILSRHGHLSNEAAAQLAGQIVSAELRHLYLGHLSSDCNRPELAHAAVSTVLTRAGAQHVRIEAASPDTPCPTLALEGGQPPSAPTAPPQPASPDDPNRELGALPARLKEAFAAPWPVGPSPEPRLFQDRFF
ncbi:MAG TPA: MBL fold metallo-hydrolase [Verrucomicrobiae bacterium]|nr:MBL fold metallo-hydrolase [Verrucomicrobiae bacterium]